MDVAGRYIAVIVTIILITLFPLQYIAKAENETVNNYVNSIASDFTDTARHKGVITRDEYEDFAEKLDGTGLYDISIEVAHPVTSKEESASGEKALKLSAKKAVPAVRLAQAEKPIQTMLPAQIIDPAQIVRQAQIVKTAQTIDLAQTIDPAQIIDPAQTIDLAQSIDPVQTTDPAQIIDPEQTVKPEQIEKPEKQLSDIAVVPSTQRIRRYSQPEFAVRAFYDDRSSEIISEYAFSGFNAAELGSQKVTISYTEDDVTKSAEIEVIVNQLLKTCPVCGTGYELDENDQDNGCPVCKGTLTGILATPANMTVSIGDPLPVTVEAVYLAGGRSVVTDWTSDYNPNLPGDQEVTITYRGLQTQVTVNIRDDKLLCPVCEGEYDSNDDGSDPGCPACAEYVTGLEVSPYNIIMNKNQPLPITVTANFRDGHTQVVTDWSTDLKAGAVGTFDATIFYKTSQAHITVTILEEGRLQCPYCGLMYSFIEHPEGCPQCYDILTGIEAALRNGGTTLSINAPLDLAITLIYKDTHRRITFTGWTVEEFHPDTPGEQMVTVSYQGLSTLLTFEVIRGPEMKTCPNGHEYYMNDDNSDPGCPYCLLEANRDNAILYFDITDNEDIVETIYRDGRYLLKKGDYLTVTVAPKTTSVRYQLTKLSFGVNEDRKGTYIFGGEAG